MLANQSPCDSLPPRQPVPACCAARALVRLFAPSVRGRAPAPPPPSHRLIHPAPHSQATQAVCTSLGTSLGTPNWNGTTGPLFIWLYEPVSSLEGDTGSRFYAYCEWRTRGRRAAGGRPSAGGAGAAPGQVAKGCRAAPRCAAPMRGRCRARSTAFRRLEQRTGAAGA